MHATRVRLRRLLSALIAEREDSQLLYIPHGEPGMRRMIARCWRCARLLKTTRLKNRFAGFGPISRKARRR